MLKAFIDRILELNHGRVLQLNIPGVYVSGPVKRIDPPRIDTLTVHSLKGFCRIIQNDLGMPLDKTIVDRDKFQTSDWKMVPGTVVPGPVRENIETLNGFDIEEVIIIVENESTVKAYSLPDPKLKYRDVYVEAKRINIDCSSKEIALPVEDMIMHLTSNFVATETLHNFLKVISNISSNDFRAYSDDGVTQTVSAKVGITRMEKIEVPNPIPLSPFRTFPEIKQPESLFVFRLRQDKNGGAPICHLKQADGERWKIDAIQRIGAFIRTELPGYLVIS